MSNPALRSSFQHSAIQFLALFVSIFTIASTAMADSHARIVRLSYLDGTVELDKADSHGFNTAYLNMPVPHQAKLWAREGQAEVEFEDGSSIRLTPETIVVFTDLSLDSSGHRSTSIELRQGTAYFDIHSRGSDSFQFQFGRERVRLAKSAHFRATAESRELEVAVFSGEVQVAAGSGSEVAVKKGETIRFNGDDPDRYYLAKGVDSENYDSWDNERAKGHDQAASTAAAWGGNNVPTYGLAELSSYGQYFYVPRLGYVWRPASAGPGWDPFGQGYWVSYPGAGYTFVSSYPWGWAPYRYGSWHFVKGHGWCWAPGSNWNSWHSVPPVHERPPHFRSPEPPRHGPPVLVVDNGVVTPAPPHRSVIDNDSIERRWARSVRIGDGRGETVRAPDPAAIQPGQGLVSTTAPAGNTPTSASGPLVGPSRLGNPRVEGWRRADDTRGEQHGRDGALGDMRPTEPAATSGIRATTPAPQPAPSASISPSPRPRPSAPAMTPRMEPRPVSPAPGMRMENRPTRMETHSMDSSPSMGSQRQSAPSPPSPSGGGPRMSAPSSGGGNGGGGRGGASSGHNPK